MALLFPREAVAAALLRLVLSASYGRHACTDAWVDIKYMSIGVAYLNLY
jgi:hypothetical protein